MNDATNETNDADNYRINNSKASTRKSFEYKSIIIENTPANINRLNTKIFALLKNLSNC